MKSGRLFTAATQYLIPTAFENKTMCNHTISKMYFFFIALESPEIMIPILSLDHKQSSMRLCVVFGLLLYTDVLPNALKYGQLFFYFAFPILFYSHLFVYT